MALTYTSNDVSDSSNNLFNSGTLSVTSGDVIVVMWVRESYGSTIVAPTYSGTQNLTWTEIFADNSAGECAVGAWWTRSPTTENRIITSPAFGGGNNALMSIRVHTGAHASNPVPTGKIYSAVGVTTSPFQQAITPTASGSALWWVGGDWNQAGTLAEITNCTRENYQNPTGAYTACVVRPTTQPRTDGNAFTIGASGTGSSMVWCAFEVQAAEEITLNDTLTLSEDISFDLIKSATIEYSAHTQTTGIGVTYDQTSFTVPSGCNKLLVFVGGGGMQSPSYGATAVSWNSVALTKNEYAYDGTWQSVEAWYLDNPDVGNYTLRIGSDGGNQIATFVVALSGAASGACPSVSDTATPSANPAVTLTGTSPGDLVFGQCHDDASNGNLAYGSGQTGLGIEDNINNDSVGGLQYIVATGSSTLSSWVCPSDYWAALAIAVSYQAPVTSQDGGSFFFFSW